MKPAPLLLLFALGIPLPARAADTDWDPARTWVCAIGVLEWKKSGDWTSFESKDRRDAQLVEFFKSRGVPQDHIAYLQDREAMLDSIRETMAAHLAKTAAGDLLVFYYCGHGSAREDGSVCFANYDAGEKGKDWTVTDILDAIEKDFKGDRALLLADCCHSGSLADEAAKRPRSRIAFAALASSSANQVSTGNWTFTQSLLDGLRGHPLIDANADGSVTLGEMAGYSKEDMALFEGQRAAFTATDRFAASTKMAKSVGEKPGERIGERVEVLWEGDWWKARIVEAVGEKVKVRWIQIGYDSADSDEWHGPEEVRPLQPRTWPKNAAVDVEWQGKWWPAKVIDTDGPLHLIHYDGYGEVWDEWVGAGRMRDRE